MNGPDFSEKPTDSDLDRVFEVFEDAWYEEPPRYLTADELCQLFADRPAWHPFIRAAYPARRRALRMSDLRLQIENAVRERRSINWDQLLGADQDLKPWAQELYARTRGRFDWSDVELMEYARARLQLKDYEGERTVHLARRLTNPKETKAIGRDFEIKGVAGRGGFGVVLIARDHVLDRDVAIKMVHPDKNRVAGVYESLAGEGQIAAKLEHPNILPVYGLLEPLDGAPGLYDPAYVMRLLPRTRQAGTDEPVVRNLEDEIRDFYANGKPWNANPARIRDFRQLLQRFVAICRGMALAHSRLVVHNDLKPKNIVIGPHGETLVHDWGICTVLDKEDTWHDPDGTYVDSQIADKGFRFPRAMTFHWCSLEQRDASRAQEVREPSDVLALGLILHNMLTNRLPEKGERPEERARVFPENTDAKLKLIVAKATAAQPWDRYIGFYERQWFEKNMPPSRNVPPPQPGATPESRPPGAEQLATAVERWLDETDPLQQQIRRRNRLLLTGAMAALCIATVASLVVAAREKQHSVALRKQTAIAKEQQANAERAEKDANQLAGAAFRLAPQLGDADLNSVQRLDALDELLKATRTTGDQSSPTVIRGLAAIQLGRCKVLQRLVRLKEAEEAGDDARGLLEALPRNQLADDDRVNLIRTLLDLANVNVDRGDIPGMKAAIDAAFAELTALGNAPNNEVKWLLLRSRTLQMLGYYYKSIGNPFLYERANVQAVADAEAAIARAENDETRFELARAQRLHSASLSDVANAYLTANSEIKSIAIERVTNAIVLLESSSNAEKGTRKWTENRYWAQTQLYGALVASERLAEAKSAHELNEVLLGKLVLIDPARPFWRLMQIQSGLQKELNQPAKGADIPKLIAKIESVQAEVQELRNRCPEDLSLATQPERIELGYGYFLLSQLAAEKPQRTQLLKRAEAELSACQKSLEKVLETCPQMHKLQADRAYLFLLMSQVAAALGNTAASSEFNLQCQRCMLTYYEARQRENPEEPTWQALIGQHLDLEARILYQPHNATKALETRERAIAAYRVISEAEPDNPYWKSLLADALQLLDAVRKPDEQLKSDIEILELRQKAWKLSQGSEQTEIHGMLFDTFAKIALKLRNPATSKVYQQHFGNYTNFLRAWRETSKLYFTDELRSRSPWKARGERPVVVEGASSVLRDRSATHYLEIRQLIARGFEQDAWNRDIELVQTCVDAVKLYRSRGFSESDETVEREIAWLLRSSYGAIDRTYRRGEKSPWLSWIEEHTKTELQDLQPPANFPWKESPARIEEWRRMDYPALARAAIEEQRLAEWFAFVNDEFQTAATLFKTEGASRTYAEGVLFRQLVDEIALDSKLRTEVLGFWTKHSNAGDWHPSLRNSLTMIAAVSGALGPAWRSVSSKIAERIVTEGLAQRRFADVRDFSESKVIDAQCELGLDSPQTALKLLDQVDSSVPGYTGWRLRALLELYRKSPAAEFLEKIGAIGSVDPADDFNAAVVAAYAQLLKSRSAEDADRLAALAEHPFCSDRLWALELVGDGWALVKRPDKAKAAYQACEEEFPPTEGDAALKRIVVKRQKLKE